ncbi:hypothetical protein WA158_000654 [Blastocystis sp. Blastoise]
MALCEFFILTRHGDRIVYRDFRQEMPKNTPEIFYRAVQFSDEDDASPVTDCDGLHFIHIKRGRFYFVFSTKNNVPVTQTLELLSRMVILFTDKLGGLTENALRKNLVLIYEMLDEIIEYGYPQSTDPALLQTYVYTPAVSTDENFLNRLNGIASQALTQVNKSNVMVKSEIYVDVIERVSATLNREGYIMNSCIDGSIKINNKVIGDATVKIQLPKNIIIGKENHKDSSYGDILYDDMNFNSKIDTDCWDRNHLLMIQPDKGTSILMNYRSTAPFKQPLVIVPLIEPVSEYKYEIILKLSSIIPAETKIREIAISMNVPSTLSGCKVELPKDIQGQVAEYSEIKKKILWYIKGYTAPNEHYLHIIINLTKPSDAFTIKEMSPINVTYVMLNYNLSQLRINGLEVTSNDDSYQIQKYLRYVSRSGAYITRI